MEFRKTLTSFVLAGMLLSQISGTLPSFAPLTRVDTAQASDTLTLSGGPQIRTALALVGVNYPDGTDMNADQGTANRVCQLVGFESASGYHSDNYDSPEDNFLLFWNGASFDQRGAADNGNRWISEVTCQRNGQSVTGEEELYLGDGFQIRNALTAVGQFYPGGTDLHADQTTANQACVFLGYTGARNFGTDHYDSPEDNIILVWNTTTQRFDQYPADAVGNDWIGTLRCVRPIQQTTLQITKTASTQTVNAGGVITFTGVVRNVGSSLARGVVVVDTIYPETVQLQSGTTSGCSVITRNSNGAVVQCATTEIPAGADKTYTFVVKVPEGTACGQTANLVDTIQAGGTNVQPAYSNQMVNPITCVQTSLTVTKTANVQNVTAGGNITFTGVVQNTGTSPANGVVVSDVIYPSDVQLRSGTTNGCTIVSRDANGAVVQCAPTDIAAGQQKTFTFAVDVPANTTCGTASANIVDTIRATANNSQTVYSNQIVNPIQCSQTTFTVDKTASSQSVNAGGVITFTARVRNTGSASATATVRDVIYPQTVELTNGTTNGCTIISRDANGAVAQCQPVTFAPNEEKIFTFAVLVPANTTCGTSSANIVDTVQVSAPNATTVSSNQIVNPIQCSQTTFNITKTANTSSVAAGGNITFTVKAKNTGNASAEATVRDVIYPSTVELAAGTTNGCTIISRDANGAVAECPVATFAPNQERTYIFVVQVPANAACGSASANIVDTAQVSAANAQLVSSAQLVNPVTCGQTNLSVTKTASAQNATAGGNITFTGVVQNTGNAPANGVVVSDVIYPSTVELAAGTTQGCTITSRDTNGAVVQCAPTDIAVGQQKTFTFVVSVPTTATCGTSTANIVDTIRAQGTNAQLVYSNQIVNPIQCGQTSFNVTKSANVTTVNPGGTVTYTITAQNSGQNSATARISDVVYPADVQLAAGTTQGCTITDRIPATGAVVDCGDAVFTAGQQRSYTIVIQVPTTMACGGQNSIVDTGRASPGANTTNFPLASSNQMVTPVTCAQTTFDVTKTANATTVNPGGSVTYTIVAKNTGQNSGIARISDVVYPADVQLGAGTTSGCVITDRIPATGAVVDCGDITFTAGQQRSFTIVIQVPTTMACGGTNSIVDTGRASPGANTTNFPLASSNQMVTPVTCGPTTFSVTKTASAQNVTPGGTVSFTIVAKNTGQNSAIARISDVVYPSDVQLAAGTTQGCTITDRIPATGAVVDCGDATFTPNQQRSYTIVIQVPTTMACGGTNNIVDTGRASPGANTTNFPLASSNQIVTPVTCPAPQFTVTKTSNVQSAAPGDIVTYTVTARNNGSVTQTATITDTVPAGMTFLQQQGIDVCSLINNQIACPPLPVAPGQTLTQQLRFQVQDTAACSSNITNVANVQVGNQNVAASNTASINVLCQAPNITVTKTGPATVNPQGVLSYNITVRNNGTATQNGMQLTDVIPAGLTFLPANSTAGCSQQGNTVSCLTQSIAPGQTVSYTLAFQIASTAQCNSTVSNTATVFKNGTFVSSSNAASTQVQCATAQFSATLSGPAVAAPGSTITYNLTVRNDGSSSQSDIRVLDNIPANLTFVPSASTAGCTQQGNAVICPAQTFAAGQSASYNLSFQLSQNAQCNSIINNAANVQQNSVTIATSNNVQTQVSCTPNTADIAVTKTGPFSVTRGGTVNYTMIVSDLGPATATNVVLHDAIPQGLVYQSSSVTGCQLINSAHEVTCNLGSITTAQPVTVTMTFLAPTIANCTQTDVQNVAHVTSESTDPNLSNNESSVVNTTLTCPSNGADLSIIKSGPSTAVRGGTITYTLVASNSGPDAATNVVVNDAVPAGLSFASASGANCVLNGSNVSCTLGSIASGASASISLTFNIPTVANCSQTTVSNTATITGANSDPNGGNNTSAAVTTTVTCPSNGNADLSVLKFGPTSASRGDTITYSMLVINNGPSAASNVVLSDPIPAGLTFVSSSGGNCSMVNNALRCTIPSIASGQASAIITATFLIPNIQSCTTTTIQNMATVSADNADPVSSNNTSTVSTVVNCTQQNSADLSVIKAGPTSAQYGDSLTYILLGINNGPTAATNVVVRDPIPAGFQFVSSSGANCSVIANELRCTIPTVASNQSTPLISVTFTAPVPQGQCSASSVTNTGFISSDTPDPLATNNQMSVTTALSCPTAQNADLSIAKSGPSTAIRGGTITYNLTVANAGPAAAANVVTHDTVPAGMTLVTNTSTATCTQNGANVDCSFGTLASGASSTVALVLSIPTVANCSTSNISNTATVTSSTADPATSNNTSTAVATSLTCPTTSSADLAILKTGPSTAVRGSTMTYGLTVTNAGPDAAASVVTHDTVPAGLTLVTHTGNANCTQTASTVDCVFGQLASGASSTVSMVFSIPTIANCVTSSISNIATVTSNTTDPASSNNVSSAVTTSLTCPTGNTADVSIIKTGPATVVRGSNINYTLTATNNGPAAATNVIVHDPIPTGLTFVSTSTTACVLNGANIDCNLGTLASGLSTTISLTFLAPVQANCVQSSVNNTATIATDTSDPVSSNNTSATVTTTVQCPADNSADLSIVKSGPSSVVRGNNAIYNLTVTNVGPATQAASIVVSDVIPTGLVFNPGSSSAACSLSGTTMVACTGTLGPSASANFTLVFGVPVIAGCTQSTISNTASVRSQLTDPVQSNNTSAAVLTTVLCPTTNSADVSITKTGPTTVVRGNTAQYTIVVTNSGPSTATGVSFIDVIPTGFTFQSATGGFTCFNNAASIQCSIGTLASGATATSVLTFNVPTIANCTQSTATNTATVSSGTSDPVASNNTSTTVTTTVTCPNTSTDLSVIKTGPSTVQRPGSITYTINATNIGPATATNVIVRDLFPTADMQYASASGGNCSLNGSEVRCNLGTMLSGAVSSFTITFTTLSISSCSDRTATNTVIISSDLSDTVTTNNQSSVNTTLTCQNTTNNITVFKTDNRTTAYTRDRLRYSIVLTNNNSTEATNVSVSDPVPYGLTILTVSDGGTVSGQQVTWNNITVPANSSKTLYLDTEVRSDVGNGTVMRNIVTVGSQTSTDETTIYSNTYNPQPPPPPSIYYPPNPPPPVYYDPGYKPTPIYYPPMPVTGTTGSQYYDQADTENVTVAKGQPKTAGTADGFGTVFMATLITIIGAGSAAAGKFLIGGAI